jgi:hypothetical protein
MTQSPSLENPGGIGLPTTPPGTIAIFTHPNAALLRFIIEKLNVPYFD